MLKGKNKQKGSAITSTTINMNTRRQWRSYVLLEV